MNDLQQHPPKPAFAPRGPERGVFVVDAGPAVAGGDAAPVLLDGAVREAEVVKSTRVQVVLTTKVPGVVPAGRGAGVDILVVDDNPINQKIARKMLQLLGYEADVVSDGREALEALRRQTYKVVLMDVHMPVMDGVEATRRIRNELASVDQPFIIAMTAAFLPEVSQCCRDAGIDELLTKPLKPGVLSEVMRRRGCTRAAAG